MAEYKVGKGGIIANPNCSTIIALMAVTPLHRVANVKRMIVSRAPPAWPPPCNGQGPGRAGSLRCPVHSRLGSLSARASSRPAPLR